MAHGAKGDMAIKCEHYDLAEDGGVLFSSGSGPKDMALTSCSQDQGCDVSCVSLVITHSLFTLACERLPESPGSLRSSLERPVSLSR